MQLVAVVLIHNEDVYAERVIHGAEMRDGWRLAGGGDDGRLADLESAGVGTVQPSCDQMLVIGEVFKAGMVGRGRARSG